MEKVGQKKSKKIGPAQSNMEKNFLKRGNHSWGRHERKGGRKWHWK